MPAAASPTIHLRQLPAGYARDAARPSTHGIRVTLVVADHGTLNDSSAGRRLTESDIGHDFTLGDDGGTVGTDEITVEFLGIGVGAAGRSA